MHAFSKVATAVLAGSLAACASAPIANANLDLARRSYLESASEPNTASLAAFEFKQASDELARATDAWRRRDATDKVDALAYIAKQRVEVAREVAKRKLAERQVA